MFLIFFDSSGKPIIRGIPACNQYDFEKIDTIISDECDQWFKTVLRAWKYYCLKNNIVEFYQPAHSVDAFNKQWFNEILDKYPEIYLYNMNPFRTGNEISRHLLSFEMVYNYKSKLILQKQPKIKLLNCIVAKFFKKRYFAAVTNSPLKLSKILSYFSVDTFCLNSCTEREQEIKLLEDLFPEKAPWEI